MNIHCQSSGETAALMDDECFYEKVIKIKGPTWRPSLFFFSDVAATSEVAWRAVKGAGFWRSS
jgi:hypothetical protein